MKFAMLMGWDGDKKNTKEGFDMCVTLLSHFFMCRRIFGNYTGS